MKTSSRLIFAGAVTLAALSLGGCSEGGRGAHSETSDETVGSRSSHNLYNETDRPVPAQPGATPGVITENAADKAIDSTHGPGGFGGTSQENDGSGTAGGISGKPASNSGPNPPATPSQQGANSNGATNQNGGGNLQLNAGPGTTANGNGYPNNGTTANPAGQPVNPGQPNNGGGTNQSGVNGNTNNAAGAARPAQGSGGGATGGTAAGAGK